MMPRRRRIAVIGFVLLVLVLVGGRLGAEFVEDLLWYRTLNMQGVFWVRWTATVAVRVTLALLFAVGIYINLAVVTRTLGAIRVRRRVGNIEIAEQLPQPYIVAVLLFIAGLSGWWLSAGISDPMAVLAALRHSPWGLNDPFHGHDVSFYVFVLPILDQLQVLCGLLVAWAAILVVSAYAVTGAIKIAGGQLQFSQIALRHLGVLAAIFLVIVAWDLWMDRYGLLLSGNGVSGAIGYTDVHARQPGLLVMSLLSVATAGAVLVGLWRDRRHIALISLAVLVAAGVLSRIVVPALVQKLVVEPNEAARERPYIARHIEFTRRAYQLDDMRTARLPYGGSSPPSDSAVLRAISEAPLWDPRPLHTTFNEKEALYAYYTFSSVHPDRYEGEQVAIGVRELDPSALPSTAQTWQNLHLTYVSGQGVVVASMAAMAQDGSPVYYVRDLGPPNLASGAPLSLQIEQPEIYFGERTLGYVVVEPDAEPMGIPLTSFWRKLVFAWAFQSRNLLLSSSVGQGSKLVYRRSIADRVHRVAPFLRLLPTRGLLPVIHEGRVVWIVDGYTATTSFPLSRRGALEDLQVRYVRNSVKATVDAITGEVRLYVVDPDDPILRTYARFFPGLLEPLDSMPEGLRAHLRYPAPLLELQAAVLGDYHLRDPNLFYARQDVWAASMEIYRAQEQQVGATYATLPLPGTDEPEFLLTLPLSARGRPNLAALLIARNDSDVYGELYLFELPREEVVPGPQQIEAQIDQNPEISQQLSLWKEGGSQVIRGRLLVVPVDSTLIYVEPLFLEANQAATPQLERVILSSGRNVVMRPTLEEAVSALFSEDAPATTPPPPQPVVTLPPQPTGPRSDPSIQRVRRLVEQAEARLRAGDWAGFGESWRALKQLLAEADSTADP